MVVKQIRNALPANQEPHIKGVFSIRIRLIDLFEFADREKITPCGLAYNLISHCNKSKDIILKENRVPDARIYIREISWFVYEFNPGPDN